jgi:hypothetical protein
MNLSAGFDWPVPINEKDGGGCRDHKEHEQPDEFFQIK